MKAFISAILFLFFLLPLGLTAQKSETDSVIKSRIDIGIGVGMGQEIAFNSFVTVNFKNNYYGGFHYYATSLASADEPKDYDSNFELFSNSNRAPKDHFTSYSAIIGRHYPTKYKAFSLSFETGVSWIIYNNVAFKKNMPSTFLFFQSNYLSDYQLHHTTGILFGGKVSYHVSPKINLDLYTYSNFSSIRTVITENLSVVFSIGKRSKKAK